MEIHSIIHYESLLYFRQYVPINMPFIGIFSARFCLSPSYPLSARLSLSVCVSYFSISFSLYISPKLSLCMHMSLSHLYTNFSIRLNLAFLPRDRSFNIFFNMYYDSDAETGISQENYSNHIPADGLAPCVAKPLLATVLHAQYMGPCPARGKVSFTYVVSEMNSDRKWKYIYIFMKTRAPLSNMV